MSRNILYGKTCSFSFMRLPSTKKSIEGYSTHLKEEQIEIFLRLLDLGKTNRDITDRFQHNAKTISCHFTNVLKAFCLFQEEVVTPLQNIHPYLRYNKNYCPWFEVELYLIFSCQNFKFMKFIFVNSYSGLSFADRTMSKLLTVLMLVPGWRRISK